VLWRVRGKLPEKELRRQFAVFQRQARAAFRAENWAGTPRFSASVDVRYRGQGYELNVPMAGNVLAAFHREHQRRYGYSRPEREVEIVTLRLRARLAGPPAPVASTARVKGKMPEKRPVIFAGRRMQTPLYEREALAARRRYRGPAIVVEYGATTVVPPGFTFRVDRSGNLLLEKA
jgi:N-methylhydantoinase A